jgi:pimeloyl-ACP methyl ester carboxylesterase
MPSTFGTVNEISLDAGRLRYREAGDGPPVVFVHGFLTNSILWAEVAPGVAEAGFRCLLPDWPVGSHQVPMPSADLTPRGVAALMADFLDRLDLRSVTIVANDTGGALTQLLMTTRPERIGRVVLTPSDCFERFPPPPFALLPQLARVPGMVFLLVQLLRIRALHRMPFAFGWLTKRPMPRAVVDACLVPSRRDPAIRRDLRRFLTSAHRRDTLAAARLLPGFDRPVLLAWAAEDRLFPVSLAHRLAAVLPNATLVTIGDSYTFVPVDQPAALTRHIVDFVRQHAPT